MIRKSVVAGSFYPAEPGELEQGITSLINQTREIPATGKLRILIVPHAGIAFSGRTAAWGFRQIKDKNYQKVILVGVSHRAFFNHAAVFNQGLWETPFGKVAIEETLANNLINQTEKIVADLAVHQDEHSLEVELIFLQMVLKSFRIVPILVSQTSEELINNLAEKIAQNFDEKTLLVVSTDLSHYPPYKTAKETDKQTIEAILEGNEEKFRKTVEKLETAGYPSLETAACGAEAIRIALKIGEKLQINNFKKIKYENSGDISGQKNQVVGYVAIGAWNNAK